MALLLGTKRAEIDPLGETSFAKAAGALDLHRADSGHVCVCCSTVWPCSPALAAAFMLDLHAA